MRARRRASPGSPPCATRSAAYRSIWLSISEAISPDRRDWPVSARHHDLTCASMSRLLRLRGQHVGDGHRQALPLPPLGSQLFAPRGGQPVIFGLPLVFAFAPLRPSVLTCCPPGASSRYYWAFRLFSLPPPPAATQPRCPSRYSAGYSDP